MNQLMILGKKFFSAEIAIEGRIKSLKNQLSSIQEQLVAKLQVKHDDMQVNCNLLVLILV